MAHSKTTTFDLPNFVGELFQKGQRPNTLLQLIGGVNPDVLYAATEFPIGQQYQVPSHTSDRSRVEGADAPDHTGVVRSQITNVTQIVQESVVVTYSKQAAHQQLSGLNIGGATNPVQDELSFQTAVKLEFIARNLNWAFINNSYQRPVDNSSPRKTRGLLDALSTNVVDAEDAVLDLDMLDELLEKMLDSGAIVDGENVIALAHPRQLRILNALFRRYKVKIDSERFVGGVRVRTVYSTFGVLNFAPEFDMPDDTIAVVNVDAMRVVGTPIPGKGVLFREPLAKTGAQEKWQIYGELGLDHGPEWLHGAIEGLSTDLPGEEGEESEEGSGG